MLDLQKQTNQTKVAWYEIIPFAPNWNGYEHMMLQFQMWQSCLLRHIISHWQATHFETIICW